MLSWDEFDSEDTTPAPAGKPAQAKPAAPVGDSPAMENQAESSVEDARQISADDSDAIARAKAALDELRLVRADEGGELVDGGMLPDRVFTPKPLKGNQVDRARV